MTTADAAADQRQQYLLDRGVEAARDQQRQTEAGLDAELLVRNARSLLARLACATTTPFGVPVEPEV